MILLKMSVANGLFSPNDIHREGVTGPGIAGQARELGDGSVHDVPGGQKIILNQLLHQCSGTNH